MLIIADDGPGARRPPVTALRYPFGTEAGVPDADRYDDWPPLLADSDRLAMDAVVVALPGRDHVEPTRRAVERGLAVLLEPPPRPSWRR